MSISTRLMLGLGFVVLLLVLLGTAGQLALASLSSAVDALLQEDYSAVEAADSLARAVDQQDAATFAAVLGDTSGYAVKRETAAREHYTAAREKLAAVNPANAIQGAALGKVDEAKGRYDDAVKRLQALPRGPESVNVYYTSVEPEYVRLSTSITELAQQAQSRGGDAGADALRVAWRTRAWAGVITAVAFAALIWTATHLYRTIVWPLSEMARTARAISNREENRRFRRGSNDELGQLAALLNSLADRLFAKQREAEQRDAAHEQILESVLDRWTDGLAVVDGRGRVVAANATFRKVLRAEDQHGGTGELRLDKHADATREPLVFRGKRELGELVRLAHKNPS